MEKRRRFDDEIEKLFGEFQNSFSRKNVVLYDKIYREVWKKDEKALEKQAEAFDRFLCEKEIKLSEHDIFAGQLQNYLMRFSQPLPKDGDPAVFDPYEVKTGPVNPPENARETAKMIMEHGVTAREARLTAYLPDGVEAGYFTHYPVGHAITGFPFVVHTGLEGIRQRIEQSLRQNNLTQAQRETGWAMQKTIESCQKYFARYQAKAKELIQTCADQRARARLQRIADAMGRLRTEPAGTFYEAVQLVILLQELILTQTKGSMSLGRIDRLLYPFLEKDRAEKKENEESAGQLIDAFMIKLAGCRSAYQNITLGGIDENGDYAGNEISRMILDSAGRLGFDQPLLSFRLNDKVPDGHWNEILDLLAGGGGFPALFWDDTIIRSRTDMGVCEQDAADYGIVGCVEPSICGKEFSNTEAMRINWCKTLELMLNGGRCPVTGKELFLREKRNLDEITSFDEFLEWYREELRHATKVGAELCNLMDRSFAEEYPSTLLSVTLQDCIDRLEDCGAKGCRYCNSAINHTGIASAVDSLAAIRELVYEKKMLTLTQLRDVLNRNFEGDGELLSYIKENVPAFGNDLPEADEPAADLVNEMAQYTQSMRNERGGNFMAGFYSVYHHAAMGRLTGALPSGRKKGESLSNGLSPVQGADQDSPAAVIASVQKMDQTRFANGMVLDIKLNPGMLKKESHRILLRRFLEVYFRQGGMEIQLNVVDRKTLLEAKRHPENFQNLLVRVSGFSAYFVNLFEELQDEIIKRTEYDHNEYTEDVVG